MLSPPGASPMCVPRSPGLLVLTSSGQEKAGGVGTPGSPPLSPGAAGTSQGQGSDLSPQKLDPCGPQGDDPAGQALLLGQRRRRGQLLGLHQAAGDAGGRCARPRRDHHPQAVVRAAPHGAPVASTMKLTRNLGHSGSVSAPPGGRRAGPGPPAPPGALTPCAPGWPQG